MNLYLMQHGEAVAEDLDPARPLSEAGRRHVMAVAARCGVHLGHVFHSDKLRARQSAEILGYAFGATVVQRQDLGPNAPVEPIAAWLNDHREDLALVGHLPFLDRLTSLLVLGDPERSLVAFRNAALLRLARTEKGWRLEWNLWPELAEL